VTLEPSRITLARLRAGLGKAELAERLGTTARTITNYETQGAPERAAAALAEALECPQTYLHLPATEPLEEERVFFRARRRSSAAQKHMATSAGRTGVELYGLITKHFELPELSLPELDGMEPEAAAQRLRLDWDLGLSPIPNSVRLVESKGIRVLTLPDGTTDVDAFSIWEKGRPFIFLSTLKSAERSRFDLAHEIGHLVLHGSLGACAKNEHDAEKEADRFASEFLMPSLFLKSKVSRDTSVPTVLKVKEFLGVSAMAAAYALHRADRLSDWSYRQTCIELVRRGYRSGEPHGMPRETSKVFGIAFPGLRRSKGWGTEAIARQLGVWPSEIHGLTFGQALADLESNQARTPERSRARLSVVS
jgi:Zn-dependent peptidase ImmA (M78 family)/transcriptional regulator with XRE-family HTH domain